MIFFLRVRFCRNLLALEEKVADEYSDAISGWDRSGWREFNRLCVVVREKERRLGLRNILWKR